MSGNYYKEQKVGFWRFEGQGGKEVEGGLHMV